MLEIENQIKKNFPLAKFSTYEIGGPAENFIAVSDKKALEAAIQWAKNNNQSITILGGGSNVLISDQGIPGLVIKLDNNQIELHGFTMSIGANAEVRLVAERALQEKMSGIEWSIGIPGSMGGAIRGNAGAHGVSFDQVVTKVLAFNIETLEFFFLDTHACNFAYRHSIFKEKISWVVWEVYLELVEGKIEEMTQAMDEYKDYRRTSQPKEPSAGCVFKNLLVQDIEKVNPSVVAMAEAEGKVRGGKIGAGYLIQKLGLKGYSVGGAKISEKHANFVVNYNQAQAQDVVAIMDYVKAKVKENYGIELENEVQYLGFSFEKI